LAEIKGLIMGGNNSNKTTIIETVPRISRFEEENYISRMNSSKYSNLEDYQSKNNNSIQMEKKNQITPRKQTTNQNLSFQIQEPNVSPIKKVKEESTLAASDSFDDLFNQAMSNKSENPFLTKEELKEIEEGMKKSNKPSYYYEEEEEEEPVKSNQKEPIKPKEPEPQIEVNQSNEIAFKNEKKDETTPIENATQDLSESYSSYIDSQIKNLSVTPFSNEKEEPEESEEFDQESLKRLQESADPKLKNSKLFDFFSKFSNSETEKNSSSTFDEIYTNIENVEKKETTEDLEPLPVIDLEQKKKEIFEKFENYDFLNDQKYQELLEFSIKKGTFNDMDEETIEKAKVKLQGKYFSKNIDQSNLFSYDEFLETKKGKENVETMETPYSQDFVNIVTKLQNGEEFQDVKIIDDKPKSSTPKLTESKLKKKVKPWEKKKELE
jgi:hypothetical protein